MAAKHQGVNGRAGPCRRRCGQCGRELLLLILFFVFPGRVEAAAARGVGEYLLSYWETEDGLPENSATAMVQTRDGYLWFGTFNGLVRFDGVRFTVFDPKNTPEIPAPEIVNVHLDHKGRLWCSTYKGMARLSKGRWERFGREQVWTNDYARTFAETRDGVLYMTGFNGGILRYAEERFEEMPAPPGDRENGYVGHVDANGFFWVAQNRFTGFWNGTGWQRVAPDYGAEQRAFGAGSARDGALWVLKDEVIWKFTREGPVAEIKLQEPVKGFWSLKEGGSGDLWICSFSEGVYQVRTNGTLTHYTAGRGLPHQSTRFVFEDRESNFWLGTSGGGLMRVKPRTFQTFGTESGLAERIVKTVVVRANGEVDVGTYGKGVARITARQGVPMARALEVEHPSYIYSLLEDRSGVLWVGSYKAGLCKITTEGAKPVPAVAGKNIAALFEDSQGRMWVASEAGVQVREGESFREVNVLRTGNKVAEVRAFEEEPGTGAIFAANEHGVFRFEKEGLVEMKAGGRSIEQIYCMKALTNGTIWMGTANRGLVRYRGGSLTTVGEAEGLPATSIAAIMDDQLGHWWLGTKRGIIRVEFRELEAAANGSRASFEHPLFTGSDGLGSVECASGFQPTVARGRDGRLWFATVKGVAVVDPRRVRINRKVPPVVIESAGFVDAKRRPQQLDISGEGELTVPAGSSQLEVEFTGLSFTAPEKMKFAYQLDRDGELVAMEEVSQRTVSLNLLPAGSYRLRVTACNNDGVWNHDGAMLAFTVLPYFWQTSWFRFTVFGVALTSLGGLFWRTSEHRVKVQREKFEQQKVLAEEKARLASVLESTSDLVGFATPTGQVLYINPAGRKLLGLSPEQDVTRLDIDEMYTAQANELIHGTALPTAIRDGTWSGETMILTPRGEEILTSQVLVAHKDSQGQVLFISAVIRDISQSRRMEEQLRLSQKMEALGTLASGIAHDFNNVLSAIIGNIELAQLDVGTEHAASESLNEVRKASMRARDLVQQILAFGRQQVHDRRVISLVPVIGEAAKLLRATLPAGIELVTTVSPETPNVLADASQMHQVLLNLCTNAWHAMPESAGRIEICADRMELSGEQRSADLRPGLYARLKVRDNGLGMDAATLDRIFEPFFTTKTRGRGTGLGLAVVHGIVKNHEGSITVASQPGGGTTFEILIPASAKEAELARPDAERAVAPLGGGEHILYLDDEAPLVFLASRALERIGYRVTGFTVPGEALAAFSKDPTQFDVVVTDFNMPGMSGLEISTAFLKIRPDVPVLLTSGYLSDELRTKAREVGVSELIYKPNTVVELREAIHQWVGENTRR